MTNFIYGLSLGVLFCTAIMWNVQLDRTEFITIAYEVPSYEDDIGLIRLTTDQVETLL